MKEYFSIGQVARLKGITIKALRFYDKIGLVRPAYVAPDSGYRYYTLEQLLLIEHIGLFKESGASLEQIAGALQSRDSVDIADFCLDQIQEAREKIRHLEDAIEKYSQIAARVYADKAFSTNPDVTYKAICARSVLSRPCTHTPTDPRTYAYYFDLYTTIRDKKLSSIYATGSVVEIDPDTLAYTYRHIYVEAQRTDESEEVVLQQLPPGEYICVNYFAENRSSQIRKLLAAIRQWEFTPKLFIEADTYLSVTEYDHPMMELQVLI